MKKYPNRYQSVSIEINESNLRGVIFKVIHLPLITVKEVLESKILKK